MTINKEMVAGLVNEALEGRDDLFVTEVKVKPDQTIYVFMDGDNGVNVDDCIRVSKYVERRLDRDSCDFELNVSSFGIGRPLQLLRQYRNAVGKTLSVKLADNTKVKGKLTAADEQQLTLELPAVKKQPAEVRTIAMSDILEAKVEVTF
ncbi:MAG: ribosome assembly cofactor RimP [Bacteroidales bacterium]|nr:ribosome assembly cofactor RimP [Bacteroidales bacterium]